MAEQLHVTNGNRVAEHVHLHTMVVDVVFLGHFVASVAHDARHGIAERGPAAVTHMHGARGVGGHVFQVDLVGSALGQRALAEIAALLTHASSNGLERRRGQLDVDEARAGDVGGGDHSVLGQVVDDDLGDIARSLVRKLCAAHGHGRGPVAVGQVARTLERRSRTLGQLQRTVFASRGDGSRKKVFKFFANLHSAKSSLSLL